MLKRTADTDNAFSEREKAENISTSHHKNFMPFFFVLVMFSGLVDRVLQWLI